MDAIYNALQTEPLTRIRLLIEQIITIPNIHEEQLINLSKTIWVETEIKDKITVGIWSYLSESLFSIKEDKLPDIQFDDSVASVSESWQKNALNGLNIYKKQADMMRIEIYRNIRNIYCSEQEKQINVLYGGTGDSRLAELERRKAEIELKQAELAKQVAVEAEEEPKAESVSVQQEQPKYSLEVNVEVQKDKFHFISNTVCISNYNDNTLNCLSKGMFHSDIDCGQLWNLYTNFIEKMKTEVKTMFDPRAKHPILDALQNKFTFNNMVWLSDTNFGRVFFISPTEPSTKSEIANIQTEQSTDNSIFDIMYFMKEIFLEDTIPEKQLDGKKIKNIDCQEESGDSIKITLDFNADDFWKAIDINKNTKDTIRSSSTPDMIKKLNEYAEKGTIPVKKA
jgi:hypothetical protein